MPYVGYSFFDFEDLELFMSPNIIVNRLIFLKLLTAVQTEVKQLEDYTVGSGRSINTS